jgi:hypothetical protein
VQCNLLEEASIAAVAAWWKTTAMAGHDAAMAAFKMTKYMALALVRRLD